MMKSILLTATCVIALVAGAANARPIGTGQESWRTNSPWTNAADPRWSDNSRQGSNWGDRGYDARGDESRMNGRHMDRGHKINCKHKKNKKACKRMKHGMRHDDMRDGMRRDEWRDGMRRDDMRNDRWHSRDAEGDRHLDLDNDGRRW